MHARSLFAKLPRAALGRIVKECSRSEMDIITAFEAVVSGSSPDGSTHSIKAPKGAFMLCVLP